MINNMSPMQMLMTMMNPGQRQTINRFQSKSADAQAQDIANFCNQNGISKEKLSQLINMFKR